MGTNCVPLVADLFLFCYERDFMLSLSENNQSDVIEALNSTSQYLDDLLNSDNYFFDSMVNRIYPSELQLKTHFSAYMRRVAFIITFNKHTLSLLPTSKDSLI